MELIPQFIQRMLKTLSKATKRPSQNSAWLKGVDHFAITVPHMEQACRFFIDVLDCEELFRMGEFRADDDHLEEHLHIHPRSVIKSHRMLACPNGFKISLFEFEAPGQSVTVPKNSDIGGHHIAFQIENVEKALSHLAKHGLEVMGRPIVFPDGPNEEITSIYFKSPWGLQMEFVCYPKGRVSHSK